MLTVQCDATDESRGKDPLCKHGRQMSVGEYIISSFLENGANDKKTGDASRQSSSGGLSAISHVLTRLFMTLKNNFSDLLVKWVPASNMEPSLSKLMQQCHKYLSTFPSVIKNATAIFKKGMVSMWGSKKKKIKAGGVNKVDLLAGGFFSSMAKKGIETLKKMGTSLASGVASAGLKAITMVGSTVRGFIAPVIKWMFNLFLELMPEVALAVLKSVKGCACTKLRKYTGIEKTVREYVRFQSMHIDEEDDDRTIDRTQSFRKERRRIEKSKSGVIVKAFKFGGLIASTASRWGTDKTTHVASKIQNNTSQVGDMDTMVRMGGKVLSNVTHMAAKAGVPFAELIAEGVTTANTAYDTQSTISGIDAIVDSFEMKFEAVSNAVIDQNMRAMQTPSVFSQGMSYIISFMDDQIVQLMGMIPIVGQQMVSLYTTAKRGMTTLMAYFKRVFLNLWTFGRKITLGSLGGALRNVHTLVRSYIVGNSNKITIGIEAFIRTSKSTVEQQRIRDTINRFSLLTQAVLTLVSDCISKDEIALWETVQNTYEHADGSTRVRTPDDPAYVSFSYISRIGSNMFGMQTWVKYITSSDPCTDVRTAEQCSKQTACEWDDAHKTCAKVLDTCKNMNDDLEQCRLNYRTCHVVGDVCVPVPSTRACPTMTTPEDCIQPNCTFDTEHQICKPLVCADLNRKSCALHPTRCEMLEDGSLCREHCGRKRECDADDKPVYDAKRGCGVEDRQCKSLKRLAAASRGVSAADAFCSVDDVCRHLNIDSCAGSFKRSYDMPLRDRELFEQYNGRLDVRMRAVDELIGTECQRECKGDRASCLSACEQRVQLAMGSATDGFVYDDGECPNTRADSMSTHDQSHKELMCIRNARCRWANDTCRPIQCELKKGMCTEGDLSMQRSLQQCSDRREMLRHVAPGVMKCDWVGASRQIMERFGAERPDDDGTGVAV